MHPSEKRHIAQLLTEATLAVEEAEAALESARARRARLRTAPPGRTLVGMHPSEKRHIAQLLTEATLAVEEAEAALESARARRARVARAATDSRYFTFKAVAEALGMTPVGLRKSLSSHPGAKE